MSESRLLIRDIKHVTDCLICGEVMRDPICFPCRHAYCLGCIETKEGRKQFGDVIQCLLCKRDVEVPEGGMEKLPSDSFIDRLIKTERSQTKKIERWCSVCCDEAEEGSDGTHGSTAPHATVFCRNCKEFMCDKCSSLHRKMRMSKSHDIESIENVDMRQELFFETNNLCGKHPGEELNVYCLDCETVACLMCLTSDHPKHNVSAVDGILEKLKEEMQKGIGRVGGVKTRNGETFEALERQEKMFLENVETAIVGIRQREEELKRLVERHCREMMENLESEKLNKMKEIENMKEDIKTNNTILDYYVKYTETLLNRGHSTDIARNTKDLKKMAEELDKEPRVVYELSVDFKPNLAIGKNNIIGATSITPLKPISYERLPKLNNAMPYNNYVQAVAAFGNELFVGFSRTSEIKVYNISTLDFQRRIHVPGLDDPWDMAATENLLFVSETDNRMIHKVELPEERTTRLTIQSRRLGLSIRTTQKSLLVTCDESNKVIECTFDGTVSREINSTYGNEIECPHHAIELVVDGTICVCHGGKPYGVRHVNVTPMFGSQIKSSKNAQKSGVAFSFSDQYQTAATPLAVFGGSGLKPVNKSASFNSPSHLACDKRGNVLVADCNNNRVVLLNSKLEYIKEIIPSSEGLKSSFKICLDEFHRKLFVADSLNKRLLAYDIF